jgi:hypothetical protein
MSLTARPPTKSLPLKVRHPLAEAADYPAWKNTVQNYLFRTIKNVDFNKITKSNTLDEKHFKKLYPDEFKDASKDAGGNEQHPFKDESFLSKCLEYAFKEGDGFHDWVYDVYDGVYNSLGDKIQDKVGQQLGDLVGLFSNIKLALHYYEEIDPNDLTIQFIKSTMAHEGKNDLMIYLSHLKRLMTRLAAAGHPISDKQGMSVLLAGLPQGIFEAFITISRRTPYATYSALQKALEADAATPHRLAQLRGLLPAGGGHIQQIYTASQVPASLALAPRTLTTDERLAKMEQLIMSMSDSKGGGDKALSDENTVCKMFARTGKCAYGDKCRFTHGEYCYYHKSPGHATHNCAVLKAAEERSGDVKDIARVTTLMAKTDYPEETRRHLTTEEFFGL